MQIGSVIFIERVLSESRKLKPEYSVISFSEEAGDTIDKIILHFCVIVNQILKILMTRRNRY